MVMTLEYSSPAWLHDVIVVTRGDRAEHEQKFFDVLKKNWKMPDTEQAKECGLGTKSTKWESCRTKQK